MSRKKSNNNNGVDTDNGVTAANAESVEPVKANENENNENSEKKDGGFKNSIFGTGIVLGIITVVTVFILAVVNSLTVPVIERRLQEEIEASVTTLFGGGMDHEILTGYEDIYMNFSAPVTEVIAVKDQKTQKLAGYCVTVTPKGFAGDIVMIVAVNPNVTVKDTQILSMNETAGQGTKIDSEDWFGEQFRYRGSNINHVKTGASPEKNEIQTIAGATVSSRAFLNGVNAALDTVDEIVRRLTDGETDESTTESENSDEDKTEGDIDE